jgi:hypothetical protein
VKKDEIGRVSQKSDQESEKLYFDSMKHLATLNTGSILLLVTFLDRLFSNPRWKALIAVTLGSFAFSILCSISSMLQAANYVKHPGQQGDLEVKIKDWTHYLALVAFLVGLSSLILFAFRNFY